MKLVEILARELKEWPDGIGVMAQWPGGEVAEPMGVGMEAKAVYVSCWIADDADDAGVTRAQWEAERARILAESQPERDPEIAKIVEKACGKRSKEDQALWDKVAMAAIQSLSASQGSNDDRAEWMTYIAEDACDIAEAFMAERAKRMKG